MKCNAIFSLDVPLIVRLDEFAQKSETPKSVVVRTALRQYLDSAEQVLTEEQTSAVCDVILGHSRRKK